MKRAIGSLAALGLLLGLVAGPASAATIVPTSLKFTVSDRTPREGQTIVFTGTLSASKEQCYAHRQVKLLRNGDVWRSKKTNSVGVVKWEIWADRNATYRLKFLGKTLGQHPNQTICEASQSRKWNIVIH